MNIKRKHILRVSITGHDKDRRKAFDYCDKHGFRITRSGPMRLKGMYYIDRFKIVAEKEEA